MPWFFRKTEPSMPDDIDLFGLLSAARKASDPRHAWKLLQRAEIMAPDSLDVQRALLMHGRLHERNPRALDYGVVKCYLLHGFEHPEKHSEEELKEMARELFEHRRLQTCLSLSPDPDAFMKQYLEDLAGEYLRIFVISDSTHVPRIFGMQAPGQLHKYLARPAADIISNMMSSPFLSAQQQVLAAKAFYRAFYRQVEGRVDALSELLGEAICRALA